jgi:hypothetical protein
MIFEEIQQRLDQDLEEYKDGEEREREEKKHTKAGRKIIADVDKLQLLCLDTHEIVVPFHGILDLVTLHQSSKKIYLHVNSTSASCHLTKPSTVL